MNSSRHGFKTTTHPDAPRSRDQKRVELRLHVRWVQVREEGSLQWCTEPSTSDTLHQKECKSEMDGKPLECRTTDHAHPVCTHFFGVQFSHIKCVNSLAPRPLAHTRRARVWCSDANSSCHVGRATL